MTLELIPAIDVLGGNVVRLHRGDYDSVTVYGADPAAMAAELEAQGASRLHVVDLDGAREGRAVNTEVIAAILARTQLRVQVGGGVRDRAAAEGWWAAGAERVVFGTAAIKDPELVASLCAEHPEGVVVAIDARGGRVAVEGWLEDSGRRATELAAEVDGWGAAAILYTDIERDGTRIGPATEATAALQRTVKATVIASGGIGELVHLRALRDQGVRAAVFGRALYSGAFTLAQAREALEHA